MLNPTYSSYATLPATMAEDLLQSTPFGAPVTLRIALKTSLQAAILGSFYAWVALSLAFIAALPSADRLMTAALVLGTGVVTYFSMLSVLMPLSALIGTSSILFVSSRFRCQLPLTLGMIGAAIGLCFSPLGLLTGFGVPIYAYLLVGFSYGASIGLSAGSRIQQLVSVPGVNFETQAPRP